MRTLTGSSAIRAPVSATPIAARGFAWSNISAAQGIGEPKVSNAAWSIADIHERSMGQMKRLALAAVPPKTGDSMPLALCALLALLSLAALTALAARRRRHG